ncbi:chromate transporter [Hymenobacter sp. DH14]|uniref:Chromate transporter n=1 Tax=Hymenobacter cyanobacteriorum TaxID=2926463 RepID=A0A9X2AH14_9BACT|nr:chromate transporter [Hymenobacter cyanobacteriorum]MCI1189816.1 chromate transporter [Hymenobacter cyanobacteriorum]
METVTTAVAPAPAYRLGDLIRYFLRLGSLGFGGPVALIGYMHRDLVAERGWISEGEYKDGLALAQIAPGPLAAQLAIYLGYVHYRLLGATLVGLAFVLPSFLMVLALSIAYTAYGGLPWMQAVFYGVGAGVIGLITVSAVKLTRKSLDRDYWLWAYYLVAAAVTIVTHEEPVLLFLGAGLVQWLRKAPPMGWLRRSGRALSLAPVSGLLLIAIASRAQSGELARIFWFFTKAGAFVFGSGLAIVPFLHAGVVEQYDWLSDAQFLDAVAVAMITPGPVVITVAFIGYLVAGLPGACVAALATFLPCYVLTVVPAPYFKKYGQRPAIQAFVAGITAAAIGALSGAVVVLAQRTLVDGPTVLLAALTGLALWKAPKLKEPVLILLAAGAGVLLTLWWP